MILPATEARVVTEALSRVRQAAEAAAQAPDTDAAKVRLQAVWSEVRRAHEALNEAERQTRTAALTNLARTFA